MSHHGAWSLHLYISAEKGTRPSKAIHFSTRSHHPETSDEPQKMSSWNTIKPKREHPESSWLIMEHNLYISAKRKGHRAIKGYSVQHQGTPLWNIWWTSEDATLKHTPFRQKEHSESPWVTMEHKLCISTFLQREKGIEPSRAIQFNIRSHHPETLDEPQKLWSWNTIIKPAKGTSWVTLTHHGTWSLHLCNLYREKKA